MTPDTPITIRVPGLPVAKPRPRASARGGFARVHAVTRGPIATFTAAVRLAGRQAYAGPPITGPIRVDIEFLFPRTKAQTWRTRPMPRLPHDKKPDRDNLDKAVLDALNGIVWCDDAQVCDGRITKWIAAGDETPGTTVTIVPLAAVRRS